MYILFDTIAQMKKTENIEPNIKKNRRFGTNRAFLKITSLPLLKLVSNGNVSQNNIQKCKYNTEYENSYINCKMENPKSGSLQFVSVLYAFPDINGKFIPTVVNWSPFIRVHQGSIIVCLDV